MSGIRSFIALEIPAEVRAALAAEAARLAGSGADVKWVAAANLHLTIKFLGDVPPDRLPRLQARLAGLADARHPFDLSVVGLGAFPSVSEPNVVWAGIAGATADLAALWRAVEDECALLGVDRERNPFAPHLTLGRRRSGFHHTSLSEAIHAGAGREYGSWRAAGMTLFRSDLRPDGPLYSSLGEFRFGATQAGV